MTATPETIDCRREWVGNESGPRHVFRLNGVPPVGELSARLEPIGEPDNAEAFSVVAGPTRAGGRLASIATGAIQFTPRREGNYEAWLVVRAEDGAETRTLVRGEGYETAECLPGEGGVMLYGHELPMTPENPLRSVVVQNTCDGVVTVEGLEPIIGAIDDFQFSAPGLPRSLEPGEAMTVDVEFHPISPQDERSLTFSLATSQGGADFTVVGRTERIFFLEEHERNQVERLIESHVGTYAVLAFNEACKQHVDRLHKAASETSFLNIVVDIALGVLLPGLGNRALGALADGLPNRTLPNWVGAKVLDHKSSIVSEAATPVQEQVKSGLLGLDTSEKETWLAGFRGQVIDGFRTLTDNVITGQFTDIELMAILAAFDKSVVTQSAYYAQIDTYLSQYDTDVAALGDGLMGAAGGFGNPMPAHVRAAWIEHEGERRVAVGHGAASIASGHAAGLEGRKPPIQTFVFQRWPAAVMRDLVVERERSISGGELQTFSLAAAGMNQKDWEQEP